SHELKTPITSMKLYVDLLLKRLRDQKDDAAIKTLKSIKYQTERLQELVKDLLDVSRLDTGKIIFNKDEFRLDSLVVETVEELRPSTKQHEILVERTPIKVYA